MPSSGNRRSSRRRFLKTAGTACVLASFAGCTGGGGDGGSGDGGGGSGDGDGDGGGSGDGDGGSDGATTEQKGWKHGKTIHYIGPPAESTWWRSMPAGHMIEANKRGWEFSFSTPGWDAAKINDQIVQFAQQKDALVVNPVAFKGHVQTIKNVQEKHNTPVVGNKDLVGGAVSHNIQSADIEMGKMMAERAIQHIEDRHGTTEDKTLVHFQGNPDFTGWERRIRAVNSVMDEHPEMNYEEIKTGGTVSGWADAAKTYFANNTADAIVSDSDGAYTRSILQALGANDQLYYVGHDEHVFVAGIDGYPSSLQYVRKGLQDLTVPQVPYGITLNIARLFHEQVLDPAVQRGKEIPRVEPGTSVGAPDDPVDIYWGPGDEITLEESEFGVPLANAPPEVYGITIDNVNTEMHWGNFLPAWVGRTDLMDVTFDPEGEKPDAVAGLADEFDQKLEGGEYGERIDYLSKIFG
jgi:ABC-type sugar transport system substrate-binding protein